MSSEGETAKQKKWWQSAQSQLPGLIAGIVTGLVVTLVGTYLTSKEPHLTYTVSDPVEFDGEKIKVSITNVTIENDGSKEAEKISSLITIRGPRPIQEVRVSPATLKATTSINETESEVVIPSLNPGEKAQISLVGGRNSLPPEVKIRAVGINGVDTQKASGDLIKILLLMLGGVFVLCSVVFSHLLSRSNVGANDEVQRARGEISLLTQMVEDLQSQQTEKQSGDYASLFTRATARILYIKPVCLLSPKKTFSLADLAKMLNESEKMVRAHLNAIKPAEKKLNTPVLFEFGDGLFVFDAVAHEAIRKLIEKNKDKEGWKEHIPTNEN